LAAVEEIAENQRYVAQKRKARQWELTSLFWFEPELCSGKSGGGHKESQR